MTRIAVAVMLVFVSAAGCAGARAATTADAHSAAIEALVRRQSQAFSDASASGDAKALAALLDDDVTFINEEGTLSTKQDLVQGAGPPPAGRKQTLVQKDLRIHLHGNVAVTTFTDVSTVDFHGQTLTQSFLSTEVWLDERAGWKMISSQTIAVQHDPPAIALPPAALDDYVGTYRAGPGYDFTIARRGNALTGSVNGGKPFPLEVEVRDVLFMPGQPRVRRIFRRDAAGAITGFVSRREGQDLFLERVRPATRGA